MDAELINSPAFKSLGKNAIHVFFGFRLRMQIHNPNRNSDPVITNNGEIVYTYIEVKKEEYHGLLFKEPSTS